MPARPGILQELEAAKRVHDIGVDYAADKRDVERTTLPLAQERRFAAMVQLPFGRTRHCRRVEGRLPDRPTRRRKADFVDALPPAG